MIVYVYDYGSIMCWAAKSRTQPKSWVRVLKLDKTQNKAYKKSEPTSVNSGPGQDILKGTSSENEG